MVRHTGDGCYHAPEVESVVGEMRRGYTLRGRVIRAALVAVGEDTVQEGDDG